MKKVQLRIGADLREAGNGAYFERLSPLSGQIATRAAAATVEDVNAAIDCAAAAFDEWSSTGPNHRRALFARVIELLTERADQFIETIIEETGATTAWAEFNVHGSVNVLRESAALATLVTGEQIPSDQAGKLAITRRVPAGVVVGMAPWNGPLLLGVRAIAMPLICGNTVVLKGSELCPATHHLIGELFVDAGFPAGVVNVILHDSKSAPAIVEALIAHEAVRRVNFTGSTRVGRIIGELAGRHLKPALLELGGKAPLVVLEDANLDQAVNAAVFSAYMHQGQICMSTERIVVDEKIADDFVSRLAAKTATLAASDPRTSTTALGSLVNETSADRVQELVDDAVNKGARLVTTPARNGSILDPIILDGVRSEMRIYAEESFGPVASVIRVKGVEEAIRVANDTEYGLAAAVFGSDIARTLRVAERIKSGLCHVNGPTVNTEAQLPFGGIKASGYGRFGGRAAIEEFTDLRLLTIQTLDHQLPF
ncbi:aldehyde dehydrogenase [Pusillimonas noertemannii]|uniref:Acyl-CoA reductase-like NAD-dependent aldehyde dehydrogenase n=1 Tax=Pusillimonas noertemannii TaxID=305977 RepID=A0A2U1CL26_9BURK|nr:aldehyde dehydrogenase [Pusillimonas noertemannii]NYT69215.1 aldehyde dehydrogenase [Pusillimonas noertemannii]PVY61684.1 acyl-CoA reductase-like NAD-dependent aldehyde dehydrogenase [Pusillimonas noertemannii]TFL09624.1 aldehyde dehydrogenase [Pusillimonas noertemannii]